MTACAGCSTCVARADCFRISRLGSLLEKVTKYGGTVMFFIGSLLFAVTTWAGTVPWVFGVFLVGHSCWLIAGLTMRDRETVWLNSMYVLFDLSAILIRI